MMQKRPTLAWTFWTLTASIVGGAVACVIAVAVAERSTLDQPMSPALVGVVVGIATAALVYRLIMALR